MYRVWCKNKNEWERSHHALLPTGELLDLRYNRFMSPENHIVQFCSKMKDTTGKYIYEGDIARGEYYNSYIVGVIVFKDGGFKIKWKGNYFFFYSDDIEIIGNIFENPELLESEEK